LQRGLVGEIISRFERKGFKLVSLVAGMQTLLLLRSCSTVLPLRRWA
jgi:nucleoside diphosphate kinase